MRSEQSGSLSDEGWEWDWGHMDGTECTEYLGRQSTYYGLGPVFRLRDAAHNRQCTAKTTQDSLTSGAPPHRHTQGQRGVS